VSFYLENWYEIESARVLENVALGVLSAKIRISALNLILLGSGRMFY